MAYVLSDGTIGSKPWFKRIKSFFASVLEIFVLFFQSMFNPALNARGNQYTTDYRKPGDPPGPPRRRLGGFATLSSCQAPMPGGG